MITYKFLVIRDLQDTFQYKYKRYNNELIFKTDLERLRNDKYVSEIKTYRLTEIEV